MTVYRYYGRLWFWISDNLVDNHTFLESRTDPKCRCDLTSLLSEDTAHLWSKQETRTLIIAAAYRNSMTYVFCLCTLTSRIILSGFLWISSIEKVPKNINICICRLNLCMWTQTWIFMWNALHSSDKLSVSSWRKNKNFYEHILPSRKDSGLRT